MTQPASLLRAVMDKARLDSEKEAEEIGRAVTDAMSTHFEPEAWAVIEEVLPESWIGEGRDRSRPQAGSVQDFFTDIGDSRDVGSAEAARYARVVAESIRENLSAEQVDVLEDTLNDDLLALFETDRRGELTGAAGYTEGAHQGVPPDEDEEPLRQP